MLDNTRLRSELAHIHKVLATFSVTAQGRPLAEELRRGIDTTNAAVLWQALFSDCLRVVHTAIIADGEIGDSEISAVYEFVFSVARHYANVLPMYRDFGAIDEDTTRSFLARYAGDSGPFGERATMHWPGLTLCRDAAKLGEPAALERYEQLMSWLIPAACEIGGVTEGDPKWGNRVAEIHALRRTLAKTAAAARPVVDLRAQAFLRSDSVFAGVQDVASVFEADPFDVEAIHQEARSSFEQLVERATSPDEYKSRGRLLLVIGESGSGKTHLLRGFRRHVHEFSRGFVAYAQMNSNTENYARYLLHHVIDSLSRPYAGPSGERTGLMELAGGLARLAPESLRIEINNLAEGDWEAGETLQQCVNRLTNSLLEIPSLARFTPDLLRVLLYSLQPDQRITARSYQYLRCENMSDPDRVWLGGVMPRTDNEHSLLMIQEIARLAHLTRGAVLVLMLDQAELSGYDQNISTKVFERALDTLYAVVSEVPSVVGVIACLTDLYDKLRESLNRPMIDRIEIDPPIERLQLNRSYAEIEMLVGRRLAWLYAQTGAAYKPEDPVFPIPSISLRRLAGRRTRDILYWCHEFQRHCAKARKILTSSEMDHITDTFSRGNNISQPPVQSPDIDQIAAAWNEASHAAGIAIPDSEDAVLELIALAAKAVASERGLTLKAQPRKTTGLRLELQGANQRAELHIAVTNRSYHGGNFARQLTELTSAARPATPVAVRTIEFPGGAGSVDAVAKLVKSGGRRAYLDDAALRTLAVFQKFQPSASIDVVAAWQRRDRPISNLGPIADIFDLARLCAPAVVDVTGDPRRITPPAGLPIVDKPAAVSNNGKTSTSKAPVGSGDIAATSPNPRNARAPICVGETASFNPERRTIPLDSFLRHTGILGSSGSGKSTLALNLIEQLLERGVGAVLLDRKGDLANYARPDWWQHTSDPERARKLAARIEVRLFTPGTNGGRPLALPVIPDLHEVPDHDRDRLVQHAANALAAMLDNDSSAGRAILAQAIAVLSERNRATGLGHLIDLIENRDDQLLARAKRYEDRLFKKLVQELETVRLRDGHLFDSKAELLTAETLLAHGRDKRVPLTIISTKFLGDIEQIQAWVAHLVGSLARYATSSPSAKLRNVFMIDEADVFMPAGMSKPPSKEPLQDLLKRARSAGLGIILASQSPGDFDYRSREQINTWFVGRVSDQRSIDKMRPLFEGKPAVAGKIAGQEPGRFVLLQDGNSVDLTRAPSLLRTDQLAEQEIMALAAANRSGA